MRVSWRLTLWAALVASCDLNTSPAEKGRLDPEFDHGNVPKYYREWGDGTVSFNTGGQWISSNATTVTAYPSWYMGTDNSDSVSKTFSVPVIDLGGVVSHELFPADYCPTTPATYAAYGTDGTLLDSGSFFGVCGEAFHVKTLVPIKRVVVYPPQPLPPDYAPGHAIYFMLGFNVPCEPTGDPNLDHPTNREKFDSSFQAGNPNGPQLDRREHIRVGYRFPDGHVESIDLNPPGARNCDIENVFVPLTNGEGEIIWVWHSHPFEENELVSQCLGREPFDKPQPYPAAPSTKDWQQLDAINYQLWIAGRPPIPGYIYDKTKTMRMEPNIIGEQPRFTVKTVDRPGPTECKHI